MSPFDCPICLERLTNSVAFTCGHGCCLPCLQASDITVCPLCRAKITGFSPTPWLDSQSNSEIDDSTIEVNFQEPNLQGESLEAYYLSRPMVDPRGETLRQAYVEINSLCVPIVSDLPDLVNSYHQRVEQENKRYQGKLRQLEAEHQKYLESIAVNSQKDIQTEETKIKKQEYHNQGMVHLATTLLALSIQPTEVLDQALPVYKSKLASLPSLWPLGISPMRPHKERAGEHYVFVPSKNDFVYEYNGYIVMGKRECNLGRHLPIIRIKFMQSESHPLGLIYVLRGEGFHCCVVVLDIDLNIVKTLPFAYARDFYLDGKTPIMIVPSQRYFTTTLDRQKVTLECKSVDNVEYFNGKLYVYSKLSNKTYVYKSPVMGSPKVVKKESGNFFISQGQVYYFTIDEATNTTDIFRQDYSCITVPGECQIYPGYKNTVLCRNGVNFTLVQL